MCKVVFESGVTYLLGLVYLGHHTGVHGGEWRKTVCHSQTGHRAICVSKESYLVRLDNEATQVFVWRMVGRNKIECFVWRCVVNVLDILTLFTWFT